MITISCDKIAVRHLCNHNSTILWFSYDITFDNTVLEGLV